MKNYFLPAIIALGVLMSTGCASRKSNVDPELGEFAKVINDFSKEMKKLGKDLGIQDKDMKSTIKEKEQELLEQLKSGKLNVDSIGYIELRQDGKVIRNPLSLEALKDMNGNWSKVLSEFCEENDGQICAIDGVVVNDDNEYKATCTPKADPFTAEDHKMFDEGQVLTEKQLTVLPDGAAPYSVSKPNKFYSLRNEGDETIVTFSYSIYFDSQWVTYSKGTTIVDELTGDRYVTRGYYPDTLTMDKLLIVQGCNHKNVLISLRFPKLKDGVKLFSIYEYDHEDDLVPSNSRTDEDSCIISRVPVEMYMENSAGKVEPKVYR